MSETCEEWGVRLEEGGIVVPGDATEDEARAEKKWFETRIPPVPAKLVKCTVTRTEWEEVNDSE